MCGKKFKFIKLVVAVSLLLCGCSETSKQIETYPHETSITALISEENTSTTAIAKTTMEVISESDEPVDTQSERDSTTQIDTVTEGEETIATTSASKPEGTYEIWVQDENETER